VFDRVWVHVYGTADAEEAHYVTLYHTKQANMRGACYQDVPIARADITHDLPDGKLCKVCLIAIHRETGVWLDGRENHEQATATA
jgi:hypothetical protein